MISEEEVREETTAAEEEEMTDTKDPIDTADMMMMIDVTVKADAALDMTVIAIEVAEGQAVTMIHHQDAVVAAEEVNIVIAIILEFDAIKTRKIVKMFRKQLKSKTVKRLIGNGENG